MSRYESTETYIVFTPFVFAPDIIESIYCGVILMTGVQTQLPYSLTAPLGLFLVKDLIVLNTAAIWPEKNDLSGDGGVSKAIFLNSGLVITAFRVICVSEYWDILISTALWWGTDISLFPRAKINITTQKTTAPLRNIFLVFKVFFFLLAMLILSRKTKYVVTIFGESCARGGALTHDIVNVNDALYQLS